MFKESNKFEKFESKVWLSSPTMHGPEIEYVKEAYETNWMSTVGKNINEVEKLACEYIGCKYAVALSAGTASLHLAMKLAGIEAYGMPKVGHGALEGKKVFCSDMTFDATVNPVVYEGGEPVFIDTEYDTWNMDPEALEKAFEIYPDTKVVVIAHLYGTPGKIEELNAVIRKHGAILIEDAAESMGATYKGVQTGTFGKYNTISFNGNKIITGSSGGCFLTDDEEAANKVRKWSTQAREKFFCFNGIAKVMFIASDRQNTNEETKFDFFDMEFNHLPFTNGHPNSNKIIIKPKSFEKMKKLAEILSEGIPQVRIDFYDINGNIYFGEMTFSHWSGFVPFIPDEWDYRLGSMINLPVK